MKHVKETVLYGLIAIIPIFIIVYATYFLITLLHKAAGSITTHITGSPVLDVIAIALLGILALVAIAYVAGILVRTRIGALSHQVIAKRLEEHIPGYEIVVNLVDNIAGGGLAYPPAWISLADPATAVLGFVMEDKGEDRVTVFVPAAPVVSTGMIYRVDRERVTMIEAGSMAAADCITKWGIGASALAATGKAAAGAGKP